jgi:hypothetical protein
MRSFRSVIQQVQGPLLAASLALLATAATAQNLVTAEDPEKILEIARGFGSAELERDDDGAPVIRGRMEGRRYSVFFYGCTDGKDCSTIQFWTFAPAPGNPLDAVNVWNREYRFGKAYIDNVGDIVIEWDVNLWGGVTAKNLDDTFDWWRGVIVRAKTVFGDPSVLPAPPNPADRQTTL